MNYKPQNNDQTATSQECVNPVDSPFFGRMNDPTAAAFVKGPCGDSMEFYLYVRDGVLEQVKCYTEGCDDTKVCGLEVAKEAEGKSVIDALAINPKEIICSLDFLPEHGRHCAILAVSTLYRAIADYLLKP